MAYGNYGGGGFNNQNQHGNAGYGGGGYSTTTYGAQGGDTGGGFLGGSQGASQSAAKGYGDNTLRPLTILQILTASQPYPEADFKIDEVDLSQLSFVGQIRNISKQTTNITYKLDDGTGTVEVKVWIDSDAPTHDDDGNPTGAGKSGLTEGMWAKVYGRMKSFGNRRHVAAFKIRPVVDMNEVNAHLLEAAYVHLYFTRGPPESLNGGQDGAVGAQGGQQDGMGAQDGDTGMVDLARQMPSLGASAKKVLNTLYNTPQNNEGLHVQVIAQQSGLSVQEVLKGADELTNHSLIFTTVDDNTWALMEQ